MKELSLAEKLKIIAKKAYELKIQRPELVMLCNKYNVDWLLGMIKNASSDFKKEIFFGALESAEPSKCTESEITDDLKVQMDILKKERENGQRISRKIPKPIS